MEENENKPIKSSKELEEKIVFSENLLSCFACGEILDEEVDECPYCGVKLNINKKRE